MADTTTKDMTQGPILREILTFAFPLMLGNIFQMLYNTVDSIVVGRFVGTEALAAMGATTLIANMAVFFFNGFSVGAGVVIGRLFGARNLEKLHEAVETTIFTTILMSIIFTGIGIFGADFLLRVMATPADVFDGASLYLRIYFAGVSGLLIYNMGSSILRAVGDSTRPLYFLILTSVLNIVLDLIFVLGFGSGIGGAALATIISQFISAFLTMFLLTRTKDIYRVTWRDLRLNSEIFRQILTIGLPTGIQSAITAFSNMFVQAYVNYFGSTVMAGWAAYNKLNQFVMLPMQTMAMAATTFVSQNVGSGNVQRENKGTKISIAVTLLITFAVVTAVELFSGPAVGLFTNDPEVVLSGQLFLHVNMYFLMFNCVNHVLAGSLRGRSDSMGPMIIMLLSFVLIRQIYLFFFTRFISNTPGTVGFGYPVGWMSCCVIEVIYFLLRWNRREKADARAIHDEKHNT
ncbi:MAG: MATE family efflux transporter [Lachnospira sp.]|nr:MATE family efflux transporter [Lachnospira sp.]